MSEVKQEEPLDLGACESLKLKLSSDDAWKVGSLINELRAARETIAEVEDAIHANDELVAERDTEIERLKDDLLRAVKLAAKTRDDLSETRDDLSDARAQLEAAVSDIGEMRESRDNWREAAQQNAASMREMEARLKDNW